MTCGITAHPTGEVPGWPVPPDIEHFDELPVRGSALLFAGLRYQSPEYIQTWKALPSDTEVQEIIRTFVIRQPILWVEQD